MSMRFALSLLLTILAGCQTASRDSTSGGRPAKRVAIAMDDLGAWNLPKLTVISDAFGPMQPILATYSDYGEKVSPPLKVDGVPSAAKSLLIIVDDPDAKEPKPFVHWTLWNLPPDKLPLRSAVPGAGQVRQLDNARQGVNSFGSVGYFGPHPPAGDPPHHYHFQVFALDRELEIEQGAKRAELIEAAQGHVLAAGELVGVFAKAKP